MEKISEKKISKKKIIAIIFALCLILVAVILVFVTIKGGRNHSKEESSELAKASKMIKALCESTDYKETCLNSFKTVALNTTDPKELVKIAFQVAVNALKEVIGNTTAMKDSTTDSRTRQALDDCDELMDSAIDDIQNSFNKMGAFDVSKLGGFLHELQTLLSGAITFQDSCWDEFDNITVNDVGVKMRKIMEISRELTSNCLAMVSQISSIFTSVDQNRKLLSYESFSGYPFWISLEKRMLLMKNPSTIKPDVVVAMDGSGRFRRISDALKMVPKRNKKTFVIYVKAGVYKEIVTVEKTMTNVMMYGDGPTRTKITGSLNYVDGVQTMKTATFSALGDNFMARDIGFENSAGPLKHQAVALRVQSNKSVFYKCRMDGYQDTLYVHAHDQFYSDCTITGTIDFIFGNAAAVLQNCRIVIRKPLEKQNCIVTAQGRKEKRSNTGIVLHNCTITNERKYLTVNNNEKAFLGRPWKEYSRTIVMQSYIDNVIQPAGWSPWDGNFALNTCWYAEYNNRGPGASQNGRVTWNGIKKIDANQASRFTIAEFIREDWIKSTGVLYVSGLM